MTKDINLRWKGPDDAVSGWQYRIYADKAATGTFGLVTTRTATTPYAAVKTTLTAAVDKYATSLSLASVTNLANNDYGITGREMFKLGGLASLTFASCLYGQYGTIPAPHAVGDTLYKAHESWADTAVSFGTEDSLPRHVIRYRIAPYVSSVERTPFQFLAIEPTPRPHNGVVCVYGIEVDAEDNPLKGVQVKVNLAAGTDYSLASGQSFLGKTLLKESDRAGYWEFMLPITAIRAGAPKITLTRYANDPNLQEVHELTTLPDVDAINYLLCI